MIKPPVLLDFLSGIKYYENVNLPTIVINVLGSPFWKSKEINDSGQRGHEISEVNTMARLYYQSLCVIA